MSASAKEFWVPKLALFREENQFAASSKLMRQHFKCGKYTLEVAHGATQELIC